MLTDSVLLNFHIVVYCKALKVIVSLFYKHI